jgi:hypothetical protein
MSTTIFIDKQGNLQGLSDDLLDMLDIGKKTVRRVSDIEWSHAENLWVAHDSETGEVIAKDKLRSNCVIAEREFLNRRVKASF